MAEVPFMDEETHAERLRQEAMWALRDPRATPLPAYDQEVTPGQLRNEAFAKSPFGAIDRGLKAGTDWIKGKVAKRRAPFSAVEQDMPPGAGLPSPLELIPTMMLEGGRTANRWLYGTKDPTQLRDEDMLGPLGASAMAAPFSAMKHGVSLGSAGGKLAAKEALDMSTEARMARAREMGFDTDTTWYHGGKSDIGEGFDLRKAGKSDPGLVGRAAYFTPEPAQASDFAMSPHYGKGDAPNVIPAHLRMRNPAVVTDGVLPDGRRLTDAHPRGITKDSASALKADLKDAGHDGVIFKTADGELTQAATFDTSGIRSPFAAFDPAKADQSGLLLADQVRSSAPAVGAEAARSARELQAPFTGQPEGIRAYHGASNPYEGDGYNPRKSQYGAFFASEDPGHASSFARSYGDAPRVYPVDIDSKAKLFDPRGNPKHAEMIAKAIEENPSLVSGSLMGRDTILRLAREGDGGIMEMPGIKAWLKKKKFDGWKFEDTASNAGATRESYGMLKPGHVRSATTGDLLYDGAGGPEAIAEALRAQQQLQSPFTQDE